MTSDARVHGTYLSGCTVSWPRCTLTIVQAALCLLTNCMSVLFLPAKSDA